MDGGWVSIAVLHWLSVWRAPGGGPPPQDMASLQTACGDTHFHYTTKVAEMSPYATVLHTRFPYCTEETVLTCLAALHRVAGSTLFWAGWQHGEQSNQKVKYPLFDGLTQNTGRHIFNHYYSSLEYKIAHVLRTKPSNKVYLAWPSPDCPTIRSVVRVAFLHSAV